MSDPIVFEATAAEQEVADLLPINAPVARCREVLRTVPAWFHTFALNQAEGIYTPGQARDHRYRIPFLPEDFRGMSVLDAGTCDGFYAFLAEARGAARVLAVDNEQHAGMARARWGARLNGGEAFRAISDLLQSEVEYRKIDALDLAGTQEQFDFIFCCGILHRVENPLGMLRTLRALLKPTGRILMETYGAQGEGAAGYPALRVLAAGEANAGDDVHHWGFSAPAITRLAAWARLTETGDTREYVIDGHPRIIATLRAG